MLTSRFSRRSVLWIFSLLVLLTGFGLTVAASGPGGGIWRLSPVGGCEGSGLRCAEWCEMVPGQGMVGTGNLCCVSMDRIGSDEGGPSCLRRPLF